MTPDEELATLIANELVAAGLLAGARRDEAAARIGAGTATLDDWRLWIELHSLRPTEGEDHAPH